MKQLFRTTAKYWVMQEGAFLAISLACLIFCVWNGMYWFGVVCIGLVILGLSSILKLRHHQIEIDDEGLLSVNKQGTVRIEWSKIIAANLSQGRNASKFLLLWTTEKEYSIPIHQFDCRKIIELIKSFVSPTALEENAIYSYPPYAKKLADMEEQAVGFEGELNVTDHWFIKAVGWGLLLCSIPAVLLLTMHELLIAILPSVFAIFGAIIVATIGSLKIDREKFTRKTLLGRYQMRWDEVRWIEHHEQETAWLLCGENKQLAIMPPQWSLGTDRELYAALLQTEIQKRAIPMKRTLTVLLKWSKNTKLN